MTFPFAIESLASHHDRAAFSSGVEAFDRYLAAQAGRDMRRRIAGCYVAIEKAANRIAGYYTIAATSMPLSEISEKMAKQLPRYPLVPSVRLGRLAVARGHQGKGLGASLLIDAIERSLRSDIVAFAMVVDAKDESGIAFYRHHGFEAFACVPMSLHLPLANFRRYEA